MNVLLTGAAGLLGGAVAASLMQAGHTVFGLVHRATLVCGNDGKPLAALPFEGSEPLAGTLIILHGDVRHDDLGLGQTTLQWLSRRIDVVVHCAALVKFEADLAALAAVNVDGTCTVARLFSHARFIHVSTAYVCGLNNGPIAEQPCDTRGEFGNAYEQSKAQSEAALLQLRPDATIARPSIIIGEAASGRIQKFDTIYRAFKFIAEGRIRAVTVTPSATLNFVPIDHVVAGLCDLVDRATARGLLFIWRHKRPCRRRTSWASSRAYPACAAPRLRAQTMTLAMTLTGGRESPSDLPSHTGAIFSGPRHSRRRHWRRYQDALRHSWMMRPSSGTSAIAWKLASSARIRAG